LSWSVAEMSKRSFRSVVSPSIAPTLREANGGEHSEHRGVEERGAKRAGKEACWRE
jgi:hypothetical protein